MISVWRMVTIIMVMENIEGENLKDIVSRREKIPVIEALDIASQICSALMVAHRSNIVHCDIKPHNIIVTPQNQVKGYRFWNSQSCQFFQQT